MTTDINRLRPILTTSTDGHPKFIFRFWKPEEREFHIVHHHPDLPSGKENPDFDKLNVRLYGGENPKWIDLTHDRYKKNRLTSVGFSLDKQQAQMLVNQLQELINLMK